MGSLFTLATHALPSHLFPPANVAEKAPGATFKVDTVAAQAEFAGNASSTCTVYGFDSRASSSTPIWAISVPSCDSSLLYDSDRFIDISDDGSTAAFSAWIYNGTQQSGELWVINAQTGEVKFTVKQPPGGLSGPIMVSETGALIAWTLGDSVAVINGTTGATRATIAMGWNTQVRGVGGIGRMNGQGRHKRG